MIYYFNMRVGIRARNAQNAENIFQKIIARRNTKSLQQHIDSTELTKATLGGEKYVPLNHVTDEKRDIIQKIELIKPHGGKTPLEEFDIEQLLFHLSKLEKKLEEEVEETVKRKLKFKKR